MPLCLAALWLQAGTDVRFGEWSTKDIEIINANNYNLLTAKPVVYLINLSEVRCFCRVVGCLGFYTITAQTALPHHPERGEAVFRVFMPSALQP
jgi:hypothetical protein